MKGKISVQANKQIGTINPDIYGHFIELVYHCFYGGIWAEMLTARKFEGDDGHVVEWIIRGRITKLQKC